MWGELFSESKDFSKITYGTLLNWRFKSIGNWELGIGAYA